MMNTICLIAAVVSQSLATATSHESVNQHRVPANRPNIVLIVVSAVIKLRECI